MSTRAAIGYFDSSIGLYRTVYCHYDGYPNHVGKVLKEYHNSFDACMKLVQGAAIRSFEKDGSYDRFDEIDYRTSENITEALNGFDYLYIFDKHENRWRCHTHSTIYNNS